MVASIVAKNHLSYLDVTSFLLLESEDRQWHWNWQKVERETGFVSVSSDILVCDSTKSQLSSVSVGEERSGPWGDKFFCRPSGFFIHILCGCQMLQGREHHSTWSDYVVQRLKTNKKIYLKSLIFIEGIMEKNDTLQSLFSVGWSWGGSGKVGGSGVDWLWRGWKSHPGQLPYDSEGLQGRRHLPPFGKMWAPGHRMGNCPWLWRQELAANPKICFS